MYLRAMVLEVKNKYCLAMTDDGAVIRIKKKDGILEGDRIYVLKEDLYHEKTKLYGLSPIFVLPEFNQKQVKKIASIAAAFILCFTMLFMIPQSTLTAYAVVSLDAKADIQFELDKSNRIIGAVSYGGTVSEDILRQFKGRTLQEISLELQQLFGLNQDSLLVGYALKSGSDTKNLDSIRGTLIALFPDQKALYLQGLPTDIDGADEKSISLGLYIAGKLVTADELEDVLEEMDLHQAMELLKNHPGLMLNEEIKEAFEEKLESIHSSSEGHCKLPDSDEDDEEDNSDYADAQGPSSSEADKPDKADDDDDDSSDPASAEEEEASESASQSSSSSDADEPEEEDEDSGDSSKSPTGNSNKINSD